MLTELPLSFTDRRTAQVALTEFRRTYRVALRGACITGPDFHKAYRVHVPLGGTGFSAAEMASAILRRALEQARRLPAGAIK